MDDQKKSMELQTKYIQILLEMSCNLHSTKFMHTNAILNSSHITNLNASFRAQLFKTNDVVS